MFKTNDRYPFIKKKTKKRATKHSTRVFVLFFFLVIYWKFFQGADMDIDISDFISPKADRPCRVVLENAIDYHHEVIESVARFYPLPWDNFNCSTSKPIIYDFALFENYFPQKVKFYIGRKPRHLNETEFWGWRKYFQFNLQGKTIERSESNHDQSTLFLRKTYVFFNALISRDQYDVSPYGPADAIIDVSCGIDKNFIPRLETEGRSYCLLHGYVPELDSNTFVRDKTCWISPMFPPDHCFFLPLALPPKSKPTALGVPNHKQIQICAPGGGGRDQTAIIQIFQFISYKKYDCVLRILTRKMQNTARRRAEKLGLLDRVEWISERDFMKYYEVVSNCDIYLPMTDPISRPAFFRTGVKGGGKSLSGSIPVIIKYKIPSVMHVELENIYHKYWTAPIEVYLKETISDQAAALDRMIEKLVSQHTVAE